MDYIKLGNSGLEVSRLCLGCMGFGDPDIWNRGQWILKKDESKNIIKKAMDLGINFFDTADVYSLGESEKILGEAIHEYGHRDEMVITTKVYFPLKDGQNNKGLSRKHIFQAVDASLKHLKTDYIDLLVIHRWDYDTPIEETMCALNDLVKSGKVLYIGASAMYAWQFQKAQYIAKANGWTQFISMQNHYNLLYREDEREMIPYCKDAKISLTPYSPLAAGRLTRDWKATTLRYQTDQESVKKYDHSEQQDHMIVDRVAMLAQQKNVTRTQIALAWLLHKPQVAAPIIGATEISHLEEAVKALDVQLSSQDMQFLEELYQPHPIVGAL